MIETACKCVTGQLKPAKQQCRQPMGLDAVSVGGCGSGADVRFTELK